MMSNYPDDVPINHVYFEGDAAYEYGYEAAEEGKPITAYCDGCHPNTPCYNGCPEADSFQKGWRDWWDGHKEERENNG